MKLRLSTADTTTNYLPIVIWTLVTVVCIAFLIIVFFKIVDRVK